MRKPLMLVAIAAVLSVLAAGVAFAHAPTITINPIGTLGPYAPTDFPVAYTITGSVTHEEELPPPGVAGDNVCAVNALQVLVGDTLLVEHGNPASAFGWACSLTTASWQADWSIPGPGTYTITAKVRHGGIAGEATDTEEVIVTQITVSECPAAPAIAGDYLRNTLGWKPVSGKFKGVMSQVAGETGVNGSLWAGNACEPGYAAAVRAFVDGIIP